MPSKIRLALIFLACISSTLADSWSPPSYVVKYDPSAFASVAKLCETERDDCVQ